MTDDKLTALAARLRDHASDYITHPDDACKHSDLLAASEHLRQCAESEHAIVPQGWKLVPLEPTVEMRRAGTAANDGIVSDIYRAMLAAAPQPPSAQAEPTIDINIKIAVPANWSNRLDMQWIVEREIHADRWSWSYAAPQAMNTQADAIEALRGVSSEHDIGYAAGWRNCADEATRIVASHIDRLEPGRQPRTRDALLDLLASMRSILVVQRAVFAAPQPPSAQADAVETLRWEKPGPVSACTHWLECLIVLSALRQGDGWLIEESNVLADDLPIAWAPDTPEARAVLAAQGGKDD